MLNDSCSTLVKNAHPSVITGWKWKAKIAEENAESALKRKEIIGTVTNGRSGLGLHPQWWLSKESTINKSNGFGRNSSSWGSEAYCYSCRTKETGCMNHVGECRRHGVTLSTWNQKIKFPYKGSLRHFTNTSQPSCLGVNCIQPIQSIWEKSQPQTYSHWMQECCKKLHVET